MAKTFFLIILFTSSIVLPQQKYFIYFKDKGSDIKNSLSKSSAEYKNAIGQLSPKSIERRMKNMGEDIITYEDLPVYNDYVMQLKNLDIKIINQISWFNSVSAILDDDKLEKIKGLPFVKSLQPVKKLFFINDKIEQISSTDLSDLTLNKSNNQTELIYGNSFKQLNLSDIPFVHSKGIDGSGVIIGLLDSGFDWKRHESLKNRNVIAEYDFIFEDSVTANQIGDSPTQDSHGTFIFSLIGGFKDSVLIGAAFNSSYILAKTEDVRSETHIEEDNYAAALIWMESLGVDITSSSLGYNTFDSGYSYTYNDMDGKTTIVTRAAELSFERGVATFTSAGNEGSSSWKYITAPADGFNTIAVGAINEFGTRAGFSSVGPTYDGRIKPEVVALGVYGFGAISGTTSSYGLNNGTSISAPLASGAAALLLSAHPHLKNTQLRSIILETSSNSSTPNNQIGYGIISAKNAIEFPNLENSNSNFILHQTILNDKILENSLTANFIIGEDVIQPYDMNKVSDYNYTFIIPSRNNGEEVQFFIEYSDSMNNVYRKPESGYYDFIYGSDIISISSNPITPTFNDDISDFFPNPFLPKGNKSVSLYFNSNGNEKIDIVIYDAIGNKVFDYSSQTASGVNTFKWNGRTNNGHFCASGAYFALIKISHRQYSKKIILLN
jgi:hypothetical protein